MNEFRLHWLTILYDHRRISILLYSGFLSHPLSDPRTKSIHSTTLWFIQQEVLEPPWSEAVWIFTMLPLLSLPLYTFKFASGTHCSGGSTPFRVVGKELAQCLVHGTCPVQVAHSPLQLWPLHWPFSTIACPQLEFCVLFPGDCVLRQL